MSVWSCPQDYSGSLPALVLGGQVGSNCAEGEKSGTIWGPGVWPGPAPKSCARLSVTECEARHWAQG